MSLIISEKVARADMVTSFSLSIRKSTGMLAKMTVGVTVIQRKSFQFQMVV